MNFQVRMVSGLITKSDPGRAGMSSCPAFEHNGRRLNDLLILGVSSVALR
jgi:hypothetical protein